MGNIVVGQLWYSDIRYGAQYPVGWWMYAPAHLAKTEFGDLELEFESEDDVREKSDVWERPETLDDVLAIAREFEPAAVAVTRDDARGYLVLRATE
jgi:hypothetical protein